MTLQQIKYALVIAEAGSLNKAAEILYISQPSLSSSIKELEGDTGITIFTRNSRGVIPTPEGEEFLSYARQVYPGKRRGSTGSVFPPSTTPLRWMPL